MPLGIGTGSGRGSLVYFNQATMFQSSETGYSTIKAAKQGGHSGLTDYGPDIQTAFMKHETRIPLPKTL